MAVESWSELSSLVPDELRPYVVDFEWDARRLWGLDLPVEPLATAELRWHLDAPYWMLDGRPFALRPRDVLRDPARFSEHYARTLNADLRYPLVVTWRGGRWAIMDGVHRLLKAALLERPSVPVRKVPARAFPLIAA